MKKILYIILSIHISLLAYGQDKWTYQECINYAIEHNLELANYRFNINSSRIGVKSAVGDFLPSVNAYAGYDINSGKTVDPNTNAIIEKEFFSNSYSISGSLTLFNGFRQLNRLSFEKLNLSAAQEVLEREKNYLAFQVIEAYITHLVQSGLVEIQKDQVELSEKEVYRIQKNKELGLVSGSEVYETEARLANDEFLLVQLQNLQKRSEFQLKKLMNLPSEDNLVVEEIDTIVEYSTLLVDNDSLYEIAKATLPGIKALKYQLDAAKKNVHISRSAFFPTLSLYGRINTGYFETYTNELGEVVAFNDQLGRNRRIGYGLSLNIPLFNGFQNRLNVQRYTIERERAQNDFNIGTQNLEYEIDQAIMDLEAAESEYQAALKRETNMQMAFTIAERKREKGLISILEFFEAKNNLGQASAEVLRTKLQLFLTGKTINFYITGSLLN